MTHTVEKIGGTSMSNYGDVLNNIILNPVKDSRSPYNRIFVVSAYAGITDKLLEHKKSSEPGVYALFSQAADDEVWLNAIKNVRHEMHKINRQLFSDKRLLLEANTFIDMRLENARRCLSDIRNVCQHGHFDLGGQLETVREMLASIGEAHSAWNMTRLLQQEGLNARFVDLTGWKASSHVALDQRIQTAFEDVDLKSELPIVTGYAHCDSGLMTTFNRGYSEMTFSRIAVLTQAKEVIIHKEYHLSSADPKTVGEKNTVPIGMTNYDIADQLANLGMEAIHPKAAKGLRQGGIPLRVKNTFEPDHPGTLITADYVSRSPCVEIIAGCNDLYALELFDQDMAGRFDIYDQKTVSTLKRFKAQIVSKDVNANTITHYLSTNIKTIKRIRAALDEIFPEADVRHFKVSLVSVLGSDMSIPGILAKSATALADADIGVLAVHQTPRQVEIQFLVDPSDYNTAIQSLHKSLVEVHDHGRAIRLAS